MSNLLKNKNTRIQEGDKHRNVFIQDKKVIITYFLEGTNTDTIDKACQEVREFWDRLPPGELWSYITHWGEAKTSVLAMVFRKSKVLKEMSGHPHNSGVGAFVKASPEVELIGSSIGRFMDLRNFKDEDTAIKWVEEKLAQRAKRAARKKK